MQTEDDRTLAEQVAEWVVGLRWNDVPDEVRASTIESVFQSVAGGVAGVDMPETQVALTFARSLGETGASTILGDGMRVPIMTALFANSVLWCSLEQQEMHVGSRTHPHEVIVPVAMVMAEQLHPDGVALLEAVLAGVEVTVALGTAAVELTPAIAQGMPNTTSIFACIGAAATAAKLLGLDAPTTAVALCHAANFGAGLTECLRQGTTEYHYSLGDASVKGWLAVQLAVAGGEATVKLLEAPSGLFAAVTTRSGAELLELDLCGRVTNRLGRTWGMPEHIYKRYPVHFPCLPLIDGAKLLRERNGFTAADIDAIHLRINAWVALCDGANSGPYTGREATRGAAAWVVGTMLAKGTFGLQEVKVLDDPEVMGLVQRTTIELIDDASNDCWERVGIEVVLKTGERFVYDSDIEGIPDYRLPMSELRSLAESALGDVLPGDQVAQVLDALASIDSCPDVASLVPLLVRA